MAKSKPIPISFTRIISGINDFDKEVTPTDGVAFARQIDFRTNPRRWTLLPKTTKESGSVITDLPLCGDRVDSDTYIYGDSGNIYKRTSSATVTLLRSVSGSHGNGLKYFGEDGYLYYPTDIAIGRYGRIGSSPTFVDDFLGAEGGVPLNTHSLDLEASSSQYATAADSATLSLTGDLAFEINFKPESLPAAGAEMVLVSKWNENSNKRSYKFSVYAVSGYFGDGNDGAETISSNTTEAPVDSACSGTLDAFTLTATNVSFATDDIILIHQSRGTGAGTWQRNKIVSYTAGTITLETALNYSYGSGAQVRVLNQYTDVTVQSGKVWTAKAWNGTVGGILAFIANGTITVTGTISANGATASSSTGASGGGFRGGNGAQWNTGQTIYGYSGEGTAGAQVQQRTANGNGGGGGLSVDGDIDGFGGGGGNANNGSDGGGTLFGYGGNSAGTADLTTMVFGGGGGGASWHAAYTGGGGGSGGGIIFISGVDLVVTGIIRSNGGDGAASSGSYAGNAGGGAGGSILLKAQTATLGTGLITANAGQGSDSGGDGSVGRIHLDYYTSYTGTTTPTLDATQDDDLVTNITYQLRLQLSSNGTAIETLTRPLSAIAIGSWGHYAVSWDASESQAEFMENGGSLGTSTGAFTSLNDNNSLFAIGASFDAAGAAQSFADGKVDDIRVWAAERTASQINLNKAVEISATSTGLNAYLQVDNSTSDSTSNANNLTLVNSPTYSTDVPFSSPTTRLDIDQEDTSSGDTYALAAAIDEGASHRQTFVPTKDPQKSISINVSDKGDSADWTVTVHDALNRTVASATVTNATLTTGVYEFVFSSVWRPVMGASYHFHVTGTNTTGAPAVVAGTNNNLETGQFKSYYQFLVSDIYHPVENVLNMIAIGNERYVATYDASEYKPHRLTFPSGWRVRCTAKWREYYAFGCWRGDSVYSHDKGIIFFWDGISDTYNFFIDVPEGAINTMYGSQGVLYIIAGYQGDLLEYTGGDKAVKVKRIPKITNDKYIEFLPGSLNMWRTLLQIGAGVTDSSDIEQGVYSWGSRNKDYVDSLSFDYKISTGTIQSTGVKIGLVLPVEKKLLIGWKDNVAFGLDSVDPSGDVYSEGSLEWSIRDEEGIWKEKKPDVLRTDFEPLVSGHTIGSQYKLDRNSSWSTEQTETTADKTYLRVQPTFARHREYQVRVNLKTSNSTSPAVLGETIMEDALMDEEFV